MNENNGRPKWAQGPEWDGWSRRTKQTIQRDTKKGPGWAVRVVKHAGWYRVEGACMQSVGSAIALANFIAEDRGGWK